MTAFDMFVERREVPGETVLPEPADPLLTLLERIATALEEIQKEMKA